jgi:tetratricopeptide (TPR) repeat protein
MKPTKLEIFIYILSIILFGFFIETYYSTTVSQAWFANSNIFMIGCFVLLVFTSFIFIGSFILKLISQNKKYSKIWNFSKYLILFYFVIHIGFFIWSQKKFNEWDNKSKKELKVIEQNDNKIFEKQMDSINKVLSKDPENDSAFYFRGLLKRQNGDFSEAIKDYRKSIKLNPKNFLYNIEISYCLKLTNEIEESEFYLRKAVNIDTNSDFAQKNRSYIDKQ